jgi:protein-S-isoprenylcysteine O-methyltransferase Ste14
MKMKKILIPPVFVFLSLVFIVLFYFLFQEWNFICFPFNLFGLLFVFVGFSIMGKARQLFSKYKTTLYFEKSAFLISDGIFCKSRNPMYCGMVLLLMGIAICFQNAFSLIIPFLFLTVIRIFFIPMEERMMTETFGDEYLNYKKTTPRWF